MVNLGVLKVKNESCQIMLSARLAMLGNKKVIIILPEQSGLYGL
jgi:hypothetical protein